MTSPADVRKLLEAAFEGHVDSAIECSDTLHNLAPLLVDLWEAMESEREDYWRKEIHEILTKLREHQC